MKFSPEDIARVCHEANRAYCRAIFDYSHKPWDDTPQNIKDSTINGVEAKLANPNVTPKESHTNWAKFKIKDGWRWGPRKSLEEKLHPNLVEYEDLPEAERLKDDLFLSIVSLLK
jgi:hypothetical protein